MNIFVNTTTTNVQLYKIEKLGDGLKYNKN